MSYEYNPKSNVVFGNVDLSDYNAYAVYCNIFDRPERDISVVSVPGRNGDLIFDNGRYKNVDRTYQIQVVGVENVHNLIRDLTSTIGYQRLEDEYDPNVYMMARLKSKPNVRKFVGNAVLLSVTFDRMPQKWDKNERLSSTPHLYFPKSINTDGSIIRRSGRIGEEHVRVDTNINDVVIKIIFRFLPYEGERVKVRHSIFVKDHEAPRITEEGLTDAIDYSYFYDVTGDTSSYVSTPRDGFCMELLFDTNDEVFSEDRLYTIAIDSENKVVYDDDTKVNLNSTIYQYRNYPELKQGDNYIYVYQRNSLNRIMLDFETSARKWSL